ncbi:MAG: chemotaxis protein CheR [Rubellimicrobium sp.]|nr:chemotaxis protein CheR [Rubellimicrobium sp.]
MQRAAPTPSPAQADPPGGRLSRRNFSRLATFVTEYSGIRLPESKLTMVEGRLRRRLRATGHASFDAYCDHVFAAGRLSGEILHLIDAVTTNKTDFFRESGHFTFLRETGLPALAAAGTRRLRAWSAACSTGAEPWSLAMVLESAFQAPDRTWSILATDLSRNVLDVARLGIYPVDHLAPVPADLRRRFLLAAADPARSEMRIHARLRARVAFGRLNLMDARYAVGEPMHVIFCRNVLIYFDRETQARVLARLCEVLAPGGYLFIGHAESVTGLDLPLRAVGNTAFQRE